MVEPYARNSLVALVHRVVASVMGVVRGGPAPDPQDVDGGPRWNDASECGDLGPRAESASKSLEGRQLCWFDYDDRFAGRYIRLLAREDHLLKLHCHVFPDGNYTYLALPADKTQLIDFLQRVADAAKIELEQ